MEKRMELLPGVTLTAVQTEKFKTGCFSINFFRPLRREEAAMNALIPSVLLRGSEGCPDLRAIAARLDELYGASAGTLIRKKGEVQMTGFYADFIEDALAGEPVLFWSEFPIAGPAPAGVNAAPAPVSSSPHAPEQVLPQSISASRTTARSGPLRPLPAGSHPAANHSASCTSSQLPA